MWTIKYCGLWNYYPQAASLSAQINLHHYETCDNSLDIKPKIVKHGKGFLLKEDSNFKYTGDSMKYFEGGWYMPSKKGWFFKTEAANAFKSKYNM